MTGTVRLLALVLGLTSLLAAVPRSEQGPGPQGFTVLELRIDAGQGQLAGWQSEVRLRGAKLVGIEGGDSDAFRDAPRYDPRALKGGRVILASLAAGDSLPAGEIVVARIHVLVEDGAEMGFDIVGTETVRPDGREFVGRTRLALPGDKR
jgi:hypothetical protein